MIRRCLTPPTGAAADAAARARAPLPVIETARLTLRAPETADFPVWNDLLAQDDKGHLGGPFTEEEAWESFCVYTAGWLLHGHGLWSVVLRDSGIVAGFVHVGLEWDDAEPELGWLFLPEHRGQGFATEAATAARDHGLALLGGGALVSYVAPDNVASDRLASRLGARRDNAAAAALLNQYGQISVWRHGDTA